MTQVKVNKQDRTKMKRTSCASGEKIYKENFIETLRIRNYSESTLQSKQQTLQRFFLFVQKAVGAVTHTDIERYYEYLRHSGQKRNTAVTHIATLKQFYTYLENMGVVFISPCKRIEYPRTEPIPVQYVLSKAEILLLLAAPDTNTKIGIRDAAILEVMYCTGVRLHELVNLSIEDIDLSEKVLFVRCGKGGKDRVLPLGFLAIDILQSYFDIRSPRYSWEKALFLHENGGRLLGAQVSVLLKGYGEKIGIKVSAHAIRRSMATHMIIAGASPIDVKEMLGHTKLETLRRYVNLNIAQVKAVHQRVHPKG